MTREAIPRFDLYAELDVPRTATFEAIEAAHRSMAKRHHPDLAALLGPDAQAESEAKIKRVNVARDWLLDRERRDRYDRALQRREGSAAGLGGDTDPESSRPAWSSFGPNSDRVRAFLVELRDVDDRRAMEIRDGRMLIDADDYAHARRAAFAISRSRRLSEWLFARDAATNVVRGQLGETRLANEVADLLAEAAGAIAIRDLLPAMLFDTLMDPWTYRGRQVPAHTPRPVTMSTVPGGTGVSSISKVFAAVRADAAARAAAHAAGRTADASATSTDARAGAEARAATPPPASVATPATPRVHEQPRPREQPRAQEQPRSRERARDREGAADRSIFGAASNARPLSSPLPRRGAIVALTASMAGLVVVATLLGAGLLNGPTFGGGVAGIEDSGGSLPSTPVSPPSPGTETPAPSAPAPSEPPGGIDPAQLAAMQDRVALTIGKLQYYQARGLVKPTQKLLGGTAPGLLSSGLRRAAYPDVNASEISIVQVPGGWQATAGKDTLRSADGVHWTFDWGGRALAHYGKGFERDLFWVSGTSHRDILVTITSVTIARNVLVVGISWRYGSDACPGCDGSSYVDDELRAPSITTTDPAGGLTTTFLSDDLVSALDGLPGKTTIRIPVSVVPSSSITLDVAVVNPSASSTGGRPFTIIETSFQLRQE